MKQPYNTGKVQIGRSYIQQSVPAHRMDRDDVRLQDALLNGHRPMDWQDRLVTWACAAAIVAIVVLLA